MDKLVRQIGQLFVIGYPGEQPPAPWLNFVDEEQIGGCILFADNCATHRTAMESVDTITSRCRSSQPLVAIDQEGGRVCRLKGAPVEFGAASVYASEGLLDRYREDYSRAVVLMKSLGINLNLAPVADLFLDSSNKCLASRCFGDDPEKAAEFVRASVTVSKQHGMLSCLKHFPGLGAASIDPHLATTEADYDEVVWKQRERIPFEAGMHAGADIIMTTHMRVRSVDSRIVTESDCIIANWIRNGLEFDGPIITDDLLMKGADEMGDIGERTVKAFKAGHDLLLFGQDWERAVEAFDYFVDAARHGDISLDAIRSSLDRVAGIKYKLRRSAVR